MGQLKLVDGAYLDEALGMVADTIRERHKTSAKLEFPAGFCEAIGELEYHAPDEMDALELFMACQLEEYTSSMTATPVTYAMRACTSLRSVSFPNMVTPGTYMFQDCANLQQADFPMATSISISMFNNCTSLVDAYFPRATAINPSCFYGCTALKRFDGVKATTINSSAFYGCASLETLILRGVNMCKLNASNVFSGTPIAGGTGYIYVPAALLESYKTASNWSAVADQFRTIEDYPEIAGGNGV